MLVLAGLALVAAVVIARLVVGGGGNDSTQPSGSTTTAGERRHGKPSSQKNRSRPVLRMAERSLAALPEPLQDAAFAPVDAGRTMLLGGLTAADTSSDSILVAAGTGARRVGTLPGPLHDAAAVRIGRFAYLFGGGDGVRQLDAIVRVDPRTGRTEVVGRLPAPSSDQSAAEIDGTAYVIGGFTGSEWLNTIVAWRPGSRAHVVARLPTAVRYAAVAAAGRKVVVAGGSLPNGTAGDAVLVFDPATGRVARVARLPAPTTHAAAAAIGDIAYVIGGRGTAVGTPTDRIAALDLATGRVRPAGRLASPRSDLAAVATGPRILLAGGRGPTGTESSISELVPERAVAAARAQNVYSFDKSQMLTGAARTARSLVYVPNSESATVDVIDPRTYKIVEHFKVGALPQHVVPAWNLEQLYVTNDLGNSLTTIDPRTGKPGKTIPVDDPYNMYFTPDGRFAIVVAERLRRLDFRDPHTFKLRHSLSVPCVGVDHLDFSADGSYLLASCEFSGQMVKVDVKGQRVVGVLDLPDGRGGMPQDVKLSPDGSVFYVADMHANGLWKIDGDRLKVVGFLPTGRGVHGLYPSRDARYLYATNRSEGSISVISFRTGKAVRKWWIPGGGSPDMGGVSVDGKVLWLSGRYSGVVYAISTRNGKLLAKIPVGSGPHGLCVWPQPGRYSLGHTGNMR
jgi:DNA-binding beta-propeller fold protein YncE